MRIISAIIKNYGAFKSAEMDLNDLSIIIGKNGAGKSTIMEGLFRFFSEFNVVGGGTSPGLQDYFWHNRDTSNPISFQVKLELDEEEYHYAFPFTDELNKAIKISEGEQARIINISRTINNPQSGWFTDHINIGKVFLVKNNLLVGQDELLKFLAPEDIIKDYGFYLFDEEASPSNITGHRLLVDKKKKLAFLSSPQIDSLAANGILEISTSEIGNDFKQWCNAAGYTLIERPPSSNEVEFPIQPISNGVMQSLSNQLANVIRSKFRYLPASRSNASLVGQRTPLIPQQIIDNFRNLYNSTQVRDERRKDKLSRWADIFFKKSITPNPTQILLKESGLYLPVQFIGGGEQELLSLLWFVQDPSCVYAIEEPENHFHPEFCRDFLKFLKDELTKESQAIVSTHSPMIVDKNTVGNNWLVKREKRQSLVEQLVSRDQLKLTLAELGLVPSDLFLKDYALFVEGGTEAEAVIPIFSENLGYPEFQEHTMTLSVGGKSQFKNYLRIWLELIKYSPVKYKVIMDKSSEDEVLYLTNELKVPSKDIIVLHKGSIEDYYPIELVKSALNEQYGFEDFQPENDEPIDHQIQKLLQKKGVIAVRWKIRLGQYIAERMTNEQIPKEVKEVIELFAK